MNNWIRRKIYKGEKFWHKFKVSRRFKKIGIPIKNCEICKYGIVEWIGRYKMSKSLYSICHFCLSDMGSNFIKQRYEPMCIRLIDNRMCEK